MLTDIQRRMQASAILTDSPGSWASVRDGKWHAATRAQPTWQDEETARCGAKFTPLNVTWNEAPPTTGRHLCAHCLRTISLRSA